MEEQQVFLIAVLFLSTRILMEENVDVHGLLQHLRQKPVCFGLMGDFLFSLF